MYQFFTEPERIGTDEAEIVGEDVNHIRNVLRMRPGEAVRVSDGAGKCYDGEIAALESGRVKIRIFGLSAESTELPAEIVLFQGLPKGDKMEWIIRKNVELGVSAIVPVLTERSIVRLEEKKAENRVKRWNAVAESAAKQSGRAVIPRVSEVIGFAQALERAKDCETRLIPYENARGMETTRRCLTAIRPGSRAAVLIGPEGGFADSEVERAREAGFVPVTLGRRILRTETAGMSLLSMLSYVLEP